MSFIDKHQSNLFPLIMVLAIVTESIAGILCAHGQGWIYAHLPLSPQLTYLSVSTILLVLFINRITKIKGMEMNYLKSFAICISILLVSWTITVLSTVWVQYIVHINWKPVLLTACWLLLIALVVAGFFQQSKIDFGPKKDNPDLID